MPRRAMIAPGWLVLSAAARCLAGLPGARLAQSYYLPKQGKAVLRYERAAFKAGCKEMETIATNGRASFP